VWRVGGREGRWRVACGRLRGTLACGVWARPEVKTSGYIGTHALCTARRGSETWDLGLRMSSGKARGTEPSPDPCLRRSRARPLRRVARPLLVSCRS
jgi:hypothetical protein